MYTRPFVVWNILCSIVAIATCFGIGLKTLSHAASVADPISITSTDTESNSIIVSRVSRGGVEYPLTRNNNSWTTNDWTRSIKVQTDSPTQITVAIGTQITQINLDPATEETTHWVLDRNTLAHHTSRLSYFSNLINWPGDMNALLRSLKPGLPFGFALWLVLALGGSLMQKYTASHSRLSIFIPIATVQVVRFGCLCVLISLAWFNFAYHSPTAYEWPALDMAPYLLHHSDPTLLTNDFYTSASLLPSPRHIFGGFILGLSSLGNTDWYSVFFILKCILVLAIPSILFLCLTSFVRNRLTPLREIIFSVVVSIGILLCLIPEYVSVFTYALWYPYQTTVTPQTVAFCLALLGITLQNHSYKKIGLVPWGIATLFHPTVAICTLLFYGILNYKKWRQHLATMLAAIIPCGILVQLLFTASKPISSVDFVFHYVASNHWFHYLPSQFATSAISPFPWYMHFVLIITLLGLLGYFGTRTKDREVTTSSLLAIVVLISSVLVCYIAIELHPSKLVATIGPSRFAQFAYWLILYLFALEVSQIKSLAVLIPTWIHKVTGPILPTHYGVLILCCFLLICGGRLKLQDNPFTEWGQREHSLSSWIAATPEDSTFATNLFEASINIPMIMHRATFTSIGFPFNSDAFSEFNTRKSLLFGSPADWAGLEGNSNHIKMNMFYRSRTISNWCIASQTFPLTYIIIEPAFSQEFISQTPAFANESYLIYETKTLCSTLTS